MLILGIETSCDETSVAVIDDHGTILSNLIASQIARHQPFGGVVPEIASREHLEHLMPLVKEALEASGASLEDLSVIGVTAGPGLIGALLVGVAGAQGLAYGLGIPLVAVNHLEGHIYSPYLTATSEAVPLPSRFLSLVVSGGHSSIYDVRQSVDSRTITMLNRTRDDAAGEVFDKVAKFIGLPYPGGPQIEKLGSTGDATCYEFAVAQFKKDSIDFSFSGLKSNAIRLARQLGLDKGEASPEIVSDFCASFQRAIIDQVGDRLDRVWDSLNLRLDPPVEIALAGGVAANSALRELIVSWASARGITPRLPEKRFCTDNAAMIAFAALQNWRAGRSADTLRVPVQSRLPIGA